MNMTLNNAPAPLHFALPVPDISAWRAGNTGVEGVWHFDSGKPGRNVMVSALVHGNELCGAWALKGLLEAGVRTEQGSLTLAFCNLAAFDRFDAAHHDASRFVDQDLNRQWLDERMDAGDSSERRRAAVLRPFVQRADWLLDIHSMHEPSAPLLLTGVQPRNLALARAMRAPEHIVVDAGHKDGVRMRDYGRFGLPDAEAGDTRSLLIECGFHGDPASLQVAAGQRFKIIVHNLGQGPVEFESTPLRIEKVLSPGVSSFVVIHPLKPGRYGFFDEFHLDLPGGRPALLAHLAGLGVGADEAAVGGDDTGRAVQKKGQRWHRASDVRTVLSGQLHMDQRMVGIDQQFAGADGPHAAGVAQARVGAQAQHAATDPAAGRAAAANRARRAW